MRLKLELNGITAELSIDEYVENSADWCKSDFSFRSGNWLDYHVENGEVFTTYEVENLTTHLQVLLQDEMKDVSRFTCMEPDFEFILCPRSKIKSRPGYNIVVIEGGGVSRMQDIYVEWWVGFWNNGHGMTSNYLSIRLEREDIQYFLAYLELVMGKRSEEDPKIVEMLEKGVLLR